MLSAKVERVGNTAVLHCAGQIVVGKRLPALRDAVLCELDKHTIFLDLSRVDRIDAGGLGLLVFLHTSMNGLGTALKLLSPSAQVTEVLKLTKLDSLAHGFQYIFKRRVSVQDHKEDPPGRPLSCKSFSA
jgi:anti-anti-sigma factor